MHELTQQGPTQTTAKKKRKTVAELEEEANKRLCKANEDNAVATATIADVRKELSDMRPQLRMLVERDPVLRAILYGPAAPTPHPASASGPRAALDGQRGPGAI